MTECPRCGHPAIVTGGFMYSTYEPVGCTDTADLRRRLTDAVTELDALTRETTNLNDQRRLEGKSEGVRLALAFVDETARGRN